MSYILDALKRADADRDRQRAAVPDLHAQSDTYPFREPAASGTPRGWWAGAALATLMVAGLVWWTLGEREAPAAATPSVVASTPPVGMPAMAPALAPPAPAAPAAPTAPPAPPAPPAPAAPAAPAPATAPTAVPPGATPPAVSPTPQPRPAPPRPAPARAPAPAAAAPPERVPLYASLPPALRSQMPALSVNGSVYSRTRANRIVILNGQVFREGDRPTDGLVVEEIRLKSSVLSFRGTRFELMY